MRVYNIVDGVFGAHDSGTDRIFTPSVRGCHEAAQFIPRNRVRAQEKTLVHNSLIILRISKCLSFKCILVSPVQEPTAAFAPLPTLSADLPASFHQRGISVGPRAWEAAVALSAEPLAPIPDQDTFPEVVHFHRTCYSARARRAVRGTREW